MATLDSWASTVSRTMNGRSQPVIHWDVRNPPNVCFLYKQGRNISIKGTRIDVKSKGNKPDPLSCTALTVFHGESITTSGFMALGVFLLHLKFSSVPVSQSAHAFRSSSRASIDLPVRCSSSGLVVGYHPSSITMTQITCFYG